MEIIESFAKLKCDTPVALTIGVFDGVHLGHQALLKTVRDTGMHTVVITFKNHPKTLIQKHSVQLIQPFKERVARLSPFVDTLYALEFNQEFRSLTAQAFLKKCKELFPLDTLVLGHDTTIGSDRVADPKVLQQWVPHIVKVPPVVQDGNIISSQKIREALEKRDIKKAELLLGYKIGWDRSATHI